MVPFAIARRCCRCSLLLPFALLACSARSRGRSAVPRYIVTASPIDVGLGTAALCIAVDTLNEHGVWWWQPGTSGCANRSTGPAVFEADQATVSQSTRSPAINVGFRLPLHSTIRPFVDIHLVLEHGSMRAVASRASVPTLRRSNLDVPPVDGSLDRRRDDQSRYRGAVQRESLDTVRGTEFGP